MQDRIPQSQLQAHAPERRCVVCHAMRPKPALWQLKHEGPERGIQVLKHGKGHRVAGRSAYLCRSEKCIHQAHKEQGKRVLRALKLGRSQPKHFLDELVELQQRQAEASAHTIQKLER